MTTYKIIGFDEVNVIVREDDGYIMHVTKDKFLVEVGYQEVEFDIVSVIPAVDNNGKKVYLRQTSIEESKDQNLDVFIDISYKTKSFKEENRVLTEEIVNEPEDELDIRKPKVFGLSTCIKFIQYNPA